MPTLGNPAGTIAVLQKYNFRFQKKFGQNFLIDPHVLDKIIRAAEVTKDDFVLEIGPGIGTMTQYLAEAAGNAEFLHTGLCSGNRSRYRNDDAVSGRSCPGSAGGGN